MASLQQQTMPQEQFLRISTNLLFKTFIEATRTEAKKVFRAAEQSDTVPLTRVVLEDESQLRFDLSLDASHFRGSLNFSTFREGLALLVHNLNAALVEKQDVKVFSEQDNPDSMIFGVMGVTREQGRTNCLALGADTSASVNARVELRLMYLDYGQFAADVSGENSGADAGESKA